jgi:hypothetical protein
MSLDSTWFRRGSGVLTAIALAGCAAAPPRAPPPPPKPAPANVARAPADGGPTPMAIDDFKHLIGMMDRSSGGDAGKLALVKTAAADNWFVAGMVAMIIDHLTYRQSKLDAVPILKDRITDRGEAFRIIDKFIYREDKAAVEQMLTSH